MGQDAERTVLAQAQDLFAGAQIAGRRVVEGVVLEGAGRVEVEAEGWKARLKIEDIEDRELEFDLGVLHEEKYTAAGAVQNPGIYFDFAAFSRRS